MEIIHSGVTTIFVSHVLDQIRRLCNKVLWLNKGKQMAFGETASICEMCIRDSYQGIPIGGYTPIIEKMLARVEVCLLYTS